jgi:hypothetical protein
MTKQHSREELQEIIRQLEAVFALADEHVKRACRFHIENYQCALAEFDQVQS